MNNRKLTLRNSTVKKSEALKEKLNAREEKKAARSRSLSNRVVNARALIPRSRSFQSPRQEKLPVKDSIEKEELGTAIVSSDTQSLEWDSDSSLTSPSFVRTRAILIDEKEYSPSQSLVKRKHSSTDNKILSADPVVENQTFTWPPKFPSEEVEDCVLNSFNFGSLEQLSDVTSEVLISDSVDSLFEEESDKMAEEQISPAGLAEMEYKSKLKLVKRANSKVINALEFFSKDTVQATDVPSYLESLKSIRIKFDEFCEFVMDITDDLDESKESEKVRIDGLKDTKNQLLSKVKENEREVKIKIQSFIENLPITKAEQETIDLQKKQIEMAKQKEESVKVEKGKKIDIDCLDVSSKITQLDTVISTMKPTSELTDQEIKQHLVDSKIWESKLEKLAESKIRLKKEVIGIKEESPEIRKLETDFSALSSNVKDKIDELKNADNERGLFSLVKASKETAVYPAPFSGADGENIFKFLDKMEEALVVNQVREKDKTEVLRKYLKGTAKDHFPSEDYVTFADAKTFLITRFG